MPPTLISSYSGRRCLRDRHERSVDQQIHQFGCYRRDDRGGLIDVIDPRSVEAVGAGFGARAKPSDRLVDIGTSAHESSRSTGENDTRAAVIDRPARGTDTLYG